MQFNPGPTMMMRRWGCAAMLLDSERVLVVGGYSGKSPLAFSEVLGVALKTERARRR
jgi:hypothetical protein